MKHPIPNGIDSMPALCTDVPAHLPVAPNLHAGAPLSIAREQVLGIRKCSEVILFAIQTPRPTNSTHCWTVSPPACVIWLSSASDRRSGSFLHAAKDRHRNPVKNSAGILFIRIPSFCKYFLSFGRIWFLAEAAMPGQTRPQCIANGTVILYSLRLFSASGLLERIAPTVGHFSRFGQSPQVVTPFFNPHCRISQR